MGGESRRYRRQYIPHEYLQTLPTEDGHSGHSLGQAIVVATSCLWCQFIMISKPNSTINTTSSQCYTVIE